MIECSKKVRSVCPYRKACGGGVYKEGSACDKFAESLQNKKAHKPGSIAITREQVEKMRGEWEEERYRGKLEGWQHRECGRHTTEKSQWCPKCGSPMTDKAVDILWKRLEAMRDDE